MSLTTQVTAWVKALAEELGFDSVGIASAEPFTERGETALERVRDGLMGDLPWYTEERVERGSDPQRILPGARSIISLAMSYLTPPSQMPADDLPRGRISNYAWGRDYCGSGCAPSCVGCRMSPGCLFRRKRTTTRGRSTPVRAESSPLSQREQEVLDLIAQGNSNKDISVVLEVSQNTVCAHIRSLMQKLHLENRTQLAVYGLREGFGQRNNGHRTEEAPSRRRTRVRAQKQDS